jgi:hypothetical protein
MSSDYKHYVNGPEPLDRVAAGNSRAYVLSTLFPSTFQTILGEMWVEMQGMAQSRGITFYPDVTELDITTTFGWVISKTLVRRLAEILNVPFWIF